jgi:hypothetical protein
MKLRILILVLLVIALISACNKTDNSEFTDSPIVESYLRPGDFAKLKVSRQISFSSNVKYSSDNIDALSIEIVVDNIPHILTPLGSGEYIDSSLIVSEGKRYDLSFIFNSKNVSAYTSVPLKPTNFTQSILAISLQKEDTT